MGGGTALPEEDKIKDCLFEVDTVRLTYLSVLLDDGSVELVGVWESLAPGALSH